MSPRAAARLLSLYPAEWRNRYGSEFLELLREHPLTLAVIVDVTMGATLERVYATAYASPDAPSAAGLGWIAATIAIGAGVNLYATVDDSPLARPMSFSVLNIAWSGIELGSLLLVLAVASAGIPIVLRFARTIGILGWRDFRTCVVPPIAIGLVTISWIVALLVITRGRWAASPWMAAAGSATGQQTWWRWTSATLSTVLLVAVLSSIARAGVRLIRLTVSADRIAGGADLSLFPPGRRLAFAARLLAASIALMLLASVAWSSAALHSAPEIMDAQLGILGLSSARSCALSILLFSIATIVATIATRVRREHPTPYAT